MLKAVTTQRETTYQRVTETTQKVTEPTKTASDGSLPRPLVMKLHKVIETNEWALLNRELNYV